MTNQIPIGLRVLVLGICFGLGLGLSLGSVSVNAP